MPCESPENDHQALYDPTWSPLHASAPKDSSQPEPELQDGAALCLSGGGLRAMLFHVGALWRLIEAGHLQKIERFSSVSGGSVTAATLALKWNALERSGFSVPAFIEEVVTPLRAFASKRVHLLEIIVLGLLLPGGVNRRLAAVYARRLFGKKTLQDLPQGEHAPRFIFNATSLQTGVLWRFCQPYMREYKVGAVFDPRIPISRVVAASSAFPPLLTPAKFSFKSGEVKADEYTTLHELPYTHVAVTGDGGIYDNLGLETVWKHYKTVLVSDGGLLLANDPAPRSNWISQTLRIIDIMDNQVRSLRMRQLFAAHAQGVRDVALWTIGSPVKTHAVSPIYPSPEAVEHLAKIPTISTILSAEDQEALINWGYAACDHALRSSIDPTLPHPSALPYPSDTAAQSVPIAQPQAA